MRKGDISIETLVAVVIGIIVLVIVIYLMFFYKRGSNLNCGFCKGLFADWCQKCATTEGNWNNAVWVDNVEMDNNLINCISECLGIGQATCASLKDNCEPYILNTPYNP